MKIIRRECPDCGTVSDVSVSERDLAAYASGMCIQQAFPTLDATTREILLTGLCPECQDLYFGADDE